ncbi:hypothetical protein [Luteolibacter sp. LG18]|uniref:hypothetical protein n=1 Tax=Luteolibacter sp. LG18 TaxID=2819286 RepID=UPI002B2F8150|nr:hypothetical protein llg_37210 [Luteolibacter sp. LG18]
MTVLTSTGEGISCRVMVRRDWDEWEVEWRIGRTNLFSSGFEGSYHFHSPEALCRTLERLHRRALDPEAGRPLEQMDWAHRPFSDMKENCRFIGTLRALHGHTRRALKRVFAFAVVPGKRGPVLEASQWPQGESFVHLPIGFLLTTRDAVRMATEGKGVPASMDALG